MLLVESAQATRRGFLTSFASFGVFGGMLLGSLTGAGIIALLPPDATATWGWRLAFLAGLILGGAAWLIRRQLPKGEEATVVDIEKERSFPIVEAVREHWRTILRVIGVQAGSSICASLCFVYITTWLQETRHVPKELALLMNGIALAALMIFIPFFGSLSDRIGRKPVLVASSLGLVLFSVPLFWLMGHESLWLILLAQCAISLILGTGRGAVSTHVAEILPKHVRCSALGIGHNINSVLFHGFTPVLAVMMIQYFGSPLAPAWYMAGMCMISLLTVSLSRSTYRPGDA